MASPTPGTPATSLRARQRERARDDILDAVTRVFAAEGGSGAVIDQIASDAGLSRATLYAHFPGGVEELIEAAYARLGTRFVLEADARLRTRVRWQDRIMTHAEVMVEWAADPSLGIFYNIVGPKVLASNHTAGVGSQSTRSLVETELIGAQERGEVSRSIDPHSIAELLTGCVKVVGVEAARDRSRAHGLLEAFRTMLTGLEQR